MMINLRTSDQAKAFFCPISMAGNLPYVSCTGNMCMAWREILCERPSSPGQASVKPEYEGYCGLAGKPIEQ